MATLSSDKARAFHAIDNVFDLPAVATDIIYKGAAVGDSSGTGRPLVAADVFMGFAVAKCDNSAGAASAKQIRVSQSGVVEIAVTGVSSTDSVGVDVYATDDDTFTLTASGASSIGTIVKWITGTTCLVAYQGSAFRSI
jgi:hypothetical protein